MRCEKRENQGTRCRLLSVPFPRRELTLQDGARMLQRIKRCRQGGCDESYPLLEAEKSKTQPNISSQYFEFFFLFFAWMLQEEIVPDPFECRPNLGLNRKPHRRANLQLLWANHGDQLGNVKGGSSGPQRATALNRCAYGVRVAPRSTGASKATEGCPTTRAASRRNLSAIVEPKLAAGR